MRFNRYRNDFYLRLACVTLLLILFIPFHGVTANSFKFKLLNASSHGIPQSSIHAIAEDQTGFIWLGTEGGLVRFDGMRARVFRSDPDDPTSLPDNVIETLLVDKQNRLWIGTLGNGLSVFDSTKDQFFPVDSKMTGSDIYASALTNTGDIVVSTNSGVYEISNKTLVVKQLVTPDRLAGESKVVGLWHGEGDTLWIATSNGFLFAYNGNDELKQIGEGGQRTFYSMKFLPKRGLLISAGEIGVLKVDLEAKKLSSVFSGGFPAKTSFYDAAESKDGSLWLATNVGLFQHESDSNKVLLARSHSGDENSLSQNEIRTLFDSSKDLLWIGTKTKGLNTLNLKSNGFESISPFRPIELTLEETSQPVATDFKLPVNLDDPTIWSVLTDEKDGLWIGSNKGLNYKPKGASSFKIINTLGKGESAINIYEAMSLESANGLIWVGTYDRGLIAYSPSENKVKYHYAFTIGEESRRLSGNAIRIIRFDAKRQCLWLGINNKGVNKLDLVTGKVTQFRHSASDSGSLPHDRVRGLYLAPDNRLWVGTGNGVSVFNDATQRFESLRYKKGNTSGLSDGDVRAFYQSDDKTMWVATGNGLNQLSINPLEVQFRFGESQGLPDSTLYSLLPDDAGNLWISTLKGLSRFNPETLAFSNFFAHHGLQDNEFNFNAWHKSTDGKLYFGGINGVTFFDPVHISKESLATDPVILSVDVFDNNLNKETLAYSVKHSISESERIKLNANQRRITVNFSSLNFIAPQEAKFVYRLRGFEDEWNTGDAEDHRATYTNLNSGNYTFELGRWSEEQESSPQISIPLMVEAKYWETIWFKILLSFLLLTMLLVFWKQRDKFVRKRAINDARLQHYRIVVHELKTPLINLKSLLERLDFSSGAESIDKNTNIVESSQNNVRRSLSFLDQLHSIVQLSGDLTREENEYLLEDVVDEAILPYTSQEEYSNNKILISPYPNNVIVRTFEGAVYLVIRNLLSNAFKHATGDSDVTLTISVDSKDIVIECLDNALPISREKEKVLYQPFTRFDTSREATGLGLGLSIIRSVVSHYEGSIKLDHSYRGGNHFIVRLVDIVKREGN